MKTNLTFSLSVAAMTASMAFAQCTTPTGGIQLGTGDDVISSITTSFPITFPGGTTTNLIDIDSNGRIFPSLSGDASDFTISIGEFLGDNHPTFAPFWVDMNPITFGSLDVIDNGVDKVTVFWNQSEFYLGGIPFDGWCELNLDGSWSVVFGGQVPQTTVDLIIGCTQGSGAADPGSMDLSTAPDSLSNPTLYEFQPAGVGDLASQRYDFIPNGSGGYVCIPSICFFATATNSGTSCDFGIPGGPPTGYGWDPDGIGGYIVAASAATFDGINLGASIGAGDDTSTTIDLQFNFTMPGGAVVSMLDVNSNGPISLVGSDFGTDNSADIGEFVTRGPAIVPWWCDLDSIAHGDILFYTDGISTANLTWLAVPQWNVAGTDLTFQVQFDGSDGSWDIVYENVASFDGAAGADDLIIGCTNGARGSLPAESDLNGGTISTSGNPTMFEYWLQGFETVDLQVLGAPLTSNLDYLTLPLVGTNFVTEVSDISPTATGVVILLGTAALGPIPLSVVFPAMPSSCSLQHNVDLGDTGALAAFTPGNATVGYTIAIPPGPSAVGFPVKLQAVIVDFSVPWAAQVGVTLTNSVFSEFGI